MGYFHFHVRDFKVGAEDTIDCQGSAEVAARAFRRRLRFWATSLAPDRDAAFLAAEEWLICNSTARVADRLTGGVPVSYTLRDGSPDPDSDRVLWVELAEGPVEECTDL